MENNNNFIIRGKQKLLFDEVGRPYVHICDGYEIRCQRGEIPDEYKKKAERELRETPENVKEGVEKLRALLKADQELFTPYENDDYLIKFLRPTKFYPESAYQLIRRYYKLRQKYPKYCANITGSNTRAAGEQGVTQTSPRLTKNGERIFQIHFYNWDPSKLSLYDIFRNVFMVVEPTMLEPMSQVNGFVLMVDVRDLTLQQILQFTPSFTLMLLDFVQECLPLRLKGIHVVNNSGIFALLYNIFKPLLGQKLRSRVFLHGNNFEKLCETIGAENLRPRYGGTMPCDVVDPFLQAELYALGEDEFEVANSFGFVEDIKNVPKIVEVANGKFLLEKRASSKNLIVPK